MTNSVLTINEKEKEYEKELKDTLLSQQFNLNRRLKPFIDLYPKMPRGQFYRKCAYTHSQVGLVPKDFPSNLLIAQVPQESNYYSNLSRTCLLFHSGYSNGLNEDKQALITLFKSNKNIDDATILEQRIELLRYLFTLLKEPKKDLKRIKPFSPRDVENALKNHEERILTLEGRK
jgi:hypothetical protein